MSSEAIIKTVVDGVEIEGVVTRHSNYDFTVTMTKPSDGITGGSHIPFFARRYDFDGEYGERRILEVLRELYEQGNPRSPVNA